MIEPGSWTSDGSAPRPTKSSSHSEPSHSATTPGRKRVLLVDHVTTCGGAEKSLLSMVSSFPKSRFDLMVVVPGPGWLSRQIDTDEVDVEFLRVESWRWWLGRRWSRLHFLATLPLQIVSLLRWLAFLRRTKPALVHFNINRIIEPVLAARLLRIPTIMHFRDIPSRMGPQFALGRGGFYRVMNLCSYWIANSGVTLEDIRPHARRSVIRIDNAIDCLDFDRRALAAGTHIDFPEGAALVAMTASLHPHKNHTAFLEVAREVARRRRGDVLFLAAGEGALEYEAELRDRALQLGIAGEFRLLGFVENVPALLSRVDLCVHTSLIESFGRVILEAMAARKPVVAFDSGGVAEIIEHGKTGVLVEPGNVEAMAGALCALLDDEEARIRLGHEGRRVVEERYSIDKHCAEIETLYATATETYAST